MSGATILAIRRRRNPLRRQLFGLATFTCTALLGSSGIVPASAQSTPPAPSGLSAIQLGTGKALSGGSWINQTSINLQIDVQVPGTPLTPQVEVEASGTPFTGTPNFTGNPVSSSGQATIHATGLQSGTTYHWQARVVDASQTPSPWTVFGSSASSDDFGVDQSPPGRPVIHSGTNPNPNRTYNAKIVSVTWSAHDSLSGIQGYTYALEHGTPHVIGTGQTTPRTGARISNLGDGVWFLAIRAQDRAGNWGPTGTYRLAIDRMPAVITWLSPKRLAYNPYHGPLSVQFKVNKPAHGTFSLYRVGSDKPVATFSYRGLRPNRVETLTWSGKGPHGHLARRGFYFFAASLVDYANNLTHVDIGGIDLHPFRPVVAATGQRLYPDGGKVIIVSLSRQTLYAYDGTKLALQTYVTTGNPALPTPTGQFQVLGRYHPYEFISPWPPGSQYYYAPSWVNWALLFRQGGYFLHDAPWRGAFGPGTNGAGQPGTNYGGSHGCVNIPPNAMLFLWNWTPIGTTVDVVP